MYQEEHKFLNQELQSTVVITVSTNKFTLDMKRNAPQFILLWFERKKKQIADKDKNMSTPAVLLCG